MQNSLIHNISNKMNKCLENFKKSINSIRTGRVSSSLLDCITIDYFGHKTQLKKLSNITIENASTLKISVFDNTIVNQIKNAILNSKLDISPILQGNIIKIILPNLTEERRKNLFKLVRSESEKSRINIRNLRRYAHDILKKYVKDKIINSDMEYKINNEIQKITDNYIKKINVLLNRKEDEIMNF